MFGLFGHKKRVDKLRTEVQDSFSHVKKDFNKVGEWIKHLDDKHGSHVDDIAKIKDQLLAIQGDLIELKDFISFFGPQLSKGLSKQTQTDEVKQTASSGVQTVVQTPVQTDVLENSSGVQTVVQTPVQTDVLENLTVMERAIVWALLNSEMKLSYEDLAALLGKDKSTIRGQINTIKQKNTGLILESREASGKKRLYVPDEVKSKIIKGIKIKINRKKSKSES